MFVLRCALACANTKLFTYKEQTVILQRIKKWIYLLVNIQLIDEVKIQKKLQYYLLFSMDVNVGFLQQGETALEKKLLRRIFGNNSTK